MTLVMIIVEHAGPALIAGQRVSGTSDLAAIRAFYSHHSLLPFYGLTGMGFIGLAFFALSFRAYLRTFQLTLVGVLLVDLATALALLEAPLIAIAAGLAAGAVLAALLPRTKVETRLLRPTADRLTDTARAAATAAKEAGTSRLAELGLTREKGAETLRSIFEGATDAAKTSAQAALSAARDHE